MARSGLMLDHLAYPLVPGKDATILGKVITALRRI
jgi:hypothetical protein